jgi:hypothetical protein
VVTSIVRVLRFASIVICLIVVASFLVFAANQTSSASGHQREVLGETPAPSQTSAKPHENSIHKGLDEASETLTSPFSGIVSGASSEWANRGVRMILALLVYGFGLGYLARLVRVRV